jgi:hypothetical protein
MTRQKTKQELEALEAKFRLRLMRDFPFYAKNNLKIRTKRAEVMPFELNSTQMLLHASIEKQLAEIGRVRHIVLKGRQVGISTYIDGRCYWKTTHKKGWRTSILAHEQDASDNLFEMANRFHELSMPQVKPSTGNSNAKELIFDVLDSGFKVATAGNKGTGRSSTIQMFHGSEVAFWPNATEHMAGVLQALADVEDSEGYFESTANGIGNVFHAKWKQAEAGDSDWRAVFLPWFLHEEYRRAIPEGALWQPEGEWIDYQEIYGLDIEQLYWAFRKNQDLLTEARATVIDPTRIAPKFKQEYPGTSAEAFETSGLHAFIQPLLVLRARKRKVEGYGPIILGVDPARGGKDKTGMIDRQGRRMGAHVHKRVDYGRNTMAIAADVKREAVRMWNAGLPLKKICVDVTGLGAGVYDRLVEIIPNAEDILEAVNFAEEAHERERFANRRAEMWWRKREWYEDKAGVQVPDSDSFQGDECAPEERPGASHFRSNGQFVLEPKEKIEQRLGFSPDEGDAAALTFAPDMTQLFMKERRKGRNADDDDDGPPSAMAA